MRTTKESNEEHARCQKVVDDWVAQGNTVEVAPIVQRAPRRLTINPRRDQTELSGKTDIEKVEHVIKLFSSTNTTHIQEFTGLQRKVVSKCSQELIDAGLVKSRVKSGFGIEYKWVGKK